MGAHFPVQSPSEYQLKVATVKLLGRFPGYVCFFTYGLDEYSGDHAEIARILRSVALRPNVKIVVSSRPIPTCTRAFRKCPSLGLKDLTREDIQDYIQENLCEHSLMHRLLREKAEEAEDLIVQVVAKSADGFLWVKLVVK